MLLSFWRRLNSLRMLGSVIDFVRHPDSLDNALKIAGSIRNSNLSAKMFRHLLDNPSMALLVAENWRPAPIDLDELAGLPKGSLGHEYAQKLLSLHLTPNSLIDPNPIANPQDYVKHRIRETHDIVHVLTGFGVDRTGELGLQAFNLAQNRSPLAVMLLFGGMLAALKHDEPLEDLLLSISRGFELGLNAKCVIAQKLEEGWDRPLSDWREELGIA